MSAPAAAAEPEKSAVAAVGASFLGIAETAGGMAILLGKIGTRMLPTRFDGQELMKNLYKMAVKSLPIVVVTALFTGAIMVIQAATIVNLDEIQRSVDQANRTLR